MSDDRTPRDPDDVPPSEPPPDEARDAEAGDADARAEDLATDPAAALGLPPVLDPSTLGGEPMQPPPGEGQPPTVPPRRESSPAAVGCLGSLSLIPIGMMVPESPVLALLVLVIALVISLGNKGKSRAFGIGMLVGLGIFAVVFGACLAALSNI
jgi:hypothetical protein